VDARWTSHASQAPSAAGAGGTPRSRAGDSREGDLFQAARLARLEEVEAAEAAELLTTVGILESGRPLTFIHPIVRSGICSDLTSPERAQGHRDAARLLAEQPGAHE
jgi:hypothetical protein